MELTLDRPSLKNWPAKDRSQKKLRSRERYLQMCVWFAEMYTPPEVATLILERYPEIENYSRQAAHRFRVFPRWAKIIRFIQKKVLADIAKVPGTHKTIRLMRLEKIYKEAMTPSLKTITQWGKVYELKLGEARNALRAITEELEGKNREGKASINITASISIIQQLHQAAGQHKEKETDLVGTSDSKSENRLRIIE